MIRLKRAYDKPAPEDGFRVLVERLWPRGVTTTEAHIDLWLKEIAPSTDLRKWFAHDPSKWVEFSVRYETELAEKKELVEILSRKSSEMRVTLVFAARDIQHNSAVILKRFIEKNR